MTSFTFIKNYFNVILNLNRKGRSFLINCIFVLKCLFCCQNHLLIHLDSICARHIYNSAVGKITCLVRSSIHGIAGNINVRNIPSLKEKKWSYFDLKR